MFNYCLERDFPGSPVIENLPHNTGDEGLIPSRKPKIPHAVEQLSPRAAAAEPVHSGACVPQLESVHHNERPRMCSEGPAGHNYDRHSQIMTSKEKCC